MSTPARGRQAGPLVPGPGFTLLELLVAMVMVAITAGAITLTFATCLQAWRRGERRADLNQEVRIVVELVSRDLCAAWLSKDMRTRASGGLEPAGGFLAGFDADVRERAADQLFFTMRTDPKARARAPRPSLPEPPRTDLAEVEYLLKIGDVTGFYSPQGEGPRGEWLALLGQEPDGLYRGLTSPPPPGPGLYERRPELVSSRVTHFNLRYFDGEEWHESWQSEQMRRLPRAVQVGLGFAGEQGEPDTYAYRTMVLLGVGDSPARGGVGG